MKLLMIIVPVIVLSGCTLEVDADGAKKVTVDAGGIARLLEDK